MLADTNMVEVGIARGSERPHCYCDGPGQTSVLEYVTISFYFFRVFDAIDSAFFVNLFLLIGFEILLISRLRGHRWGARSTRRARYIDSSRAGRCLRVERGPRNYTIIFYIFLANIKKYRYKVENRYYVNPRYIGLDQ